MHDTPTPIDRARLTRLVEDQRTAMLTVLAPDGQLHSKPMAVIDHDAQGCFWFFVEDDRRHGTVHFSANLAFSDEGAATYVSMPGHAEVLTDLARVRALWTPRARPWFPDGPDTAGLALLKFTPARAEVWDGPGSGLDRALAMAASIATGRPVGQGEPAVCDDDLGPAGVPPPNAA